MSIFRRVLSVRPAVDDRVMSVIGQTRLFENLSLSDIERLAEQVTVRTFNPGDLMFREGDEGDGLYVIDEGSVEIFIAPEGNRKSLAVLFDRDYFGEMALIDDGGRRTASAEARSQTHCLYLGKAAFDDLLASSHVTAAKILFQLCRVLSRRLARTSHDRGK